MIVPNYIPEPLEVPRNVTEEPYHVRVAYIRHVTLLHLAGLMLLAVLAYLPWPKHLGVAAFSSFAGVVLVLDIWRINQRGQPIEARVSAYALPVVLALGAWVAAVCGSLGWPVGAPLAGVICAAIYTKLSGRDFSFVGCTFLSLILSSVALAALCLHYKLDATQAAFALGSNALYLLYFEYDLASLLARRRLGEEWGAVVDLYRDVFNIFGYTIRCIRHWRKHRIWELPR